VKRSSEATFGKHLQTVRDLGVLRSQSLEIADEFNRVRNRFLHWKPGSRDRAYRGNDVTGIDGARAWLTDLTDFLGDPGLERLLLGLTPRLLSMAELLRPQPQAPNQ
jgi:hypothetical protein